MATAGTARLDNVVMHLDWNQASIDTDHVTAEAGTPGDYVPWTPMELAYLLDWNAIYVPDGTDLLQAGLDGRSLYVALRGFVNEEAAVPA